MIIIFMLIGAGGAAVASLVSTPIYTSTTRIFVSVAPSALATPGDLVQANNFAIQKVASYVAVVPSERVMAVVVDKLGLSVTPRELAEHVTASTALNTVILDITASDTNPQQAALIAEGVSSAFSDIVINELESPAGGGPGPVKVEIIQAASIPTDPSEPQTLLNIALGALAGFMTGLVIAIILMLLDSRVHKLADAARITGRPILGGIGRLSRSSASRITMVAEPRSDQAESYRSLRTALWADGLGTSGATTLLVTSSVDGEGKTSLVANLGIAFAENSASVLLIDADLRAPGLTDVFRMTPSAGLGDVLAGRATLDSAKRRTDDGLVDLLSAGAPVANPSEMLGSQAMAQLLLDAKSRYDVIILDSPPLLPVTDAAVLSTAVDSVMMIAAAGTVTRNDLRASVAILRNIRANVVGVAVTKLPRKGPDSYRYARFGSEAIDSESMVHPESYVVDQRSGVNRRSGVNQRSGGSAE